MAEAKQTPYTDISTHTRARWPTIKNILGVKWQLTVRKRGRYKLTKLSEPTSTIYHVSKMFSVNYRLIKIVAVNAEY